MRDQIRQDEIINHNCTKFFRVRERDFVANPEAIVEECLKFIYG